MANRWERGKLGPYTMPTDFTTGGIALGGINNTKPAVGLKLLLPANTVFFSSNGALDNNLTYKILNGAAISRTAFPEIFSVLGTVFGSGDGSTTFNLPNPIGTYPRVVGTPAASGLFQFQASVMGDHRHSAPAFTASATTGAIPLNYNPTGFLSTMPIDAWLGNPDSVPRPTFRSVRYAGNNPSADNAGGVRMTRAGSLNAYITAIDVQLPVGGIVGYIGDDSTSPFGPNYVLCGFGQGSPDMRGLILAGPGVAAGNVPFHTHQETSPATNLYTTPMLASGNYSQRFHPGGGGSGSFGPTFLALDGTSVGIGPATETRPVNMAVNFFMRVR